MQHAPDGTRWPATRILIGAVAAVVAVGAVIGAVKALSYEPPAWGYVVISAGAALGSLAIGWKVLLSK